MQNVETIKRNIDLPHGDWQLISYGRLVELPTIKVAIWISAIFRKVRVENDLVVEWYPTVVERHLPAAEMIVFDPGCIFSGETLKVRRAQHISNKIVQTKIEIEFTDENCKLIRRFLRNEEGKLYLDKAHYELTDNSNAYLLSVICTNGQKILIPCTTVLQAFWGRSSNLFHMLLDTRFLNFHRYVINTELSKLDRESGKAFLLLRQWSLDEDARFLATIAFDEVAVSRGKAIALGLCSLPPKYKDIEERYITARPPHTTKVVLDVWGQQLQSEELGNYLYVQRVIKSSYKPPFKSLTYDRDNDGRPATLGDDVDGEGKGKDKKPMNRPSKPGPPRFEGKSEFELTSKFSGPNETSESKKVGGFDQMFPNISDLDAIKLPQLETEYANDPDGLRVAKRVRWVGELSVLPSTATVSSDVVKTTLSSAQFVRDYTLDTNTSGIKIYLSKLIAAYEDFKSGDAHSLGERQTIEPRFPWPKSPVVGGDLVFSLPASIEEQHIAWLYTDPERTTRKRVLCLEVTFLSESSTEIGIGYIIDIEARFPKPKISKEVDDSGKPKMTQNIGSTSMVFVWRAGQTLQNGGAGNKIGDLEFRELLKAIAVHGGYTGAKKNFPKGCLTQARKHSANGISFAKLLEELEACVLGG